MDGFKKFLLRGNVVDLAVAVVIGAAFGAVVTAFVDAFITPLVGVFTGAAGRFEDDAMTSRCLAVLLLAVLLLMPASALAVPSPRPADAADTVRRLFADLPQHIGRRRR